MWLAQRNTGVQSTPGRPEPVPLPRRLGVAAAGFAVVVLTAAAGVAADPSSLGIATAPQASVAATGQTTEVQVHVEGMRFVPNTIEVPAGNRLQITLVNTGTDRHDLVLANGARTERIAPGTSAVLDAGVIGSDLDGWCSVAGHRQMGMTLTVKAIGTAPGMSANHHAARPQRPSIPPRSREAWGTFPVRTSWPGIHA